MFRCFDEPTYLEKSLKYVESRLHSASAYQIPYYVRDAMELMEKLQYPETAIEEFRLRYRYLPEIRKMEIDDAIAKKRYESAITLLYESKELDQDNPRLVCGYVEKIIDIYEQTAQTEKLVSALRSYLSSFSQRELKYIQKYKCHISPDQWEEAVQKLLLLPTVKPIKCDLLLDEEKYRELFDEVKRIGSLSAFCRYESVLQEHYPAEALLY